ncbi:MAG: hypothetical protein KatS3mg102_2374 [Planctomycetota bacterium]|nr:MAG: hypothetical protein KatS3mg102_2374 [Planctomycetota bacterium]
MASETGSESERASPAALAAELRAALWRPEPELAAVRALLQRLGPAERVAALKRLKGRDMARLFELCAQSPPLGVADLLPLPEAAGRTVVWEGVNSLPVFRRFQKRFYRARPEEPELAGYNHQPLEPLTGPGCFVARAAEPAAPGAVVLDYTRTPQVQPPGWPRVRPPARGLGRLVYGGMQDYMRRVTDDVLIGRAWRYGQPTDNYFVLVRGGLA